MKLLPIALRCGLLLTALCAVTLLPASPPVGLWKGDLKVPGSGLAIEVSLDCSEEGVWSGTIDIPAQGLRGYVLAKVEVGEVEIGFAMEGVPGTPRFKGLYEAETQRISGDFIQGGQQLKFELNFAGAEAGPESVSGKGIPGEGVVGEWLGELKAGPMLLRLALHVRAEEGDGLAGEMDSLDQGANGLPLNSVSFEAGAFAYRIDRVGGSFEGALNEDGSQLVGHWVQGGQELPLVFRRLAEPAALRRPQEPRGPFPYEEREVRFGNQVDGLDFAGTFACPAGEGPFPTVLFVSGSGPQDRDESLMGHKPFAVIADALARRGVASLRYDDRGVGGSEGDLMNSETASFANDAIAAIRFLETLGEVDVDALGLIGHSEGGLVGPMVAAREPQLDFLVLLAPPGEPLDRLLLRQSSDGLRLKGVEEELLQRVERDSQGDMELIKNRALSREELVAALRKRSEEVRAGYGEGVLESLGFTDAVFEDSLQVVSTKWFRSLMNIDPRVYLDSLTLPTLALFGEKDVQVAAEVNAAVVSESFERAGNADALVLIRPGLNHLFQNCDTGSVEEYGRIEETFDVETLELLGDWILERES